MRTYLQKIDTETRGNRYDVTPLFADAFAFQSLVSDLSEPYRQLQIDRVACIDALGFVLGTAIAVSLGVGVLTIRKEGKLPSESGKETLVDYSGCEKSLEIRSDAVRPKDRILLVDDWIETGSQIAAAMRLVERYGGVIVGIATIHMDRNESTDAIRRSCQVTAASSFSSDFEQK